MPDASERQITFWRLSTCGTEGSVRVMLKVWASSIFSTLPYTTKSASAALAMLTAPSHHHSRAVVRFPFGRAGRAGRFVKWLKPSSMEICAESTAVRARARSSLLSLLLISSTATLCGFSAFSLHFLWSFPFLFARGIDGFPADRKWNGILGPAWRSLGDEKAIKVERSEIRRFTMAPLKWVKL